MNKINITKASEEKAHFQIEKLNHPCRFDRTYQLWKYGYH